MIPARPRRSRRENYVTEWYGFRVWPSVDDSPGAIQFQRGENCPFISAATGTPNACAKQDRTGVCTISAVSNRVRRDWLACPARILDIDHTLLGSAVRRSFGVSSDEPMILRPVTALEIGAVRDEIKDTLQAGSGRVFVFTQIFLGGEVKVPSTAGSPQVAIDSSVMELLPGDDGGFRLGKYLLFEIQTMDFHGSPLHAVRHLREARNADPEGYHRAVVDHPEWPGDRVEGPNIANVFKRTIYQKVCAKPRSGQIQPAEPRPVATHHATHQKMWCPRWPRDRVRMTLRTHFLRRSSRFNWPVTPTASASRSSCHSPCGRAGCATWVSPS